MSKNNLFMQRFLFRFIACLLIPLTVSADPLWASGIAHGLGEFSSAAPSGIFPGFMSTQALQTSLIQGFAPKNNPSAQHIRENEGARILHRSASRRQTLLQVVGAAASGALTMFVIHQQEAGQASHEPLVMLGVMAFPSTLRGPNDPRPCRGYRWRRE